MFYIFKKSFCLVFIFKNPNSTELSSSMVTKNRVRKTGLKSDTIFCHHNTFTLRKVYGCIKIRHAKSGFFKKIFRGAQEFFLRTKVCHHQIFKPYSKLLFQLSVCVLFDGDILLSWKKILGSWLENFLKNPLFACLILIHP